MKFLLLLLALAKLTSGIIYFDNRSGVSNERLEITYYRNDQQIGGAGVHYQVQHPEDATHFSIGLAELIGQVESERHNLEPYGQYTIEPDGSVNRK